MSEVRHAYLIMAHHELPLLFNLISALDYTENDLYVHVDKKRQDFQLKR